MTTQTLQSTGTSTMPRVNLMPPEIAEAAEFRQVQFILGGILAVVVAIVGFLYYHAHSGIASAKSELAQQQSQQTALQAKLASLASVKATFADVQAKQGELATAMGQEVRWSFILNDLSFRIPSNVWLTSMAVTEQPPAAAAGGSLTPAAATPGAAAVVPIGTISFNGTGLKHDDVASWLDALAKEKSFLNPTFTSSTESTLGSRSIVTFASSVILDSLALSNRYALPASSTNAASATSSTGVTP